MYEHQESSRVKHESSETCMSTKKAVELNMKVVKRVGTPRKQ